MQTTNENENGATPMQAADTITDSAVTDAGHEIDTAAVVRALCEHLDCGPEDIDLASYDHYGLPVYIIGREEYAIGSDSEAAEAVVENIKDSIWAFNADFLARFTDLPVEMFQMAQKLCEAANDGFLKCVERADGGLAAFVSEAVSEDGRGHFLSSYNGEEEESGEFYIYRTN
jgi:hypothetical protein